MRWLVTGGAGFLGAHLVDRLLAGGDEVVGVDNFSTGARANVAPYLDRDAFTLVEADVADALPVEGPFDVVAHLASPATVAHHAAHPIATLRAGSEGTRRALDRAAADGAVFVLASSSEVYGDPEVHPQVESYPGRVDPVAPRAAYAEAKRFAEALVAGYVRERGTRGRIARIFNTYGPRMRADDGRVVPQFITRALAGEPLPVHGAGRQTRSLCYASDMVEALVRLARAGPEADARPVNLGNPEEVSVLQLAEEVRELAGSTSEIVHTDHVPGDPTRRRPDVALAHDLLAWRPEVSRAEGLARTIRYFKERT